MNVLPILNSNFVSLCESIVDGNLKKAKFESKATVCKYVVPRGYPENPSSGKLIDVGEESIKKQGALLYYAAVDQKNDKIYTSSSRSLGIVGIGDSIEEAESICENVMGYIKGDVYHRRDIGTRELIQKRIKHMEEIKKE